MRKIIAIKCPYCGNPMNMHEDPLFRRDPLLDGGIIWRCSECIYFWDERFFNKFHQFEHCVQRRKG